jgi:hypothetical protein
MHYSAVVTIYFGIVAIYIGIVTNGYGIVAVDFDNGRICYVVVKYSNNTPVYDCPTAGGIWCEWFSFPAVGVVAVGRGG